MKKLKFLLAALSFTAGSKSFAQNANANPSLSIGIEVGLPTGDFNKGSNVGIGGSAKLAIPVVTNGSVTLSAGYMSFSGKTITAGIFSVKNPTIGLIPFKAGFQYKFSSGFYIEPQLGITNVKLKGYDSESDFTYAINLGYAVKTVDISVRYESLSKSGNTNSFVGLRAAYNFSL